MNVKELGDLSIKCCDIAIGLHQRPFCSNPKLSREIFNHITVEPDGYIEAVFNAYSEEAEMSVRISNEELNMSEAEIEKKTVENIKARRM